MYITVYFGNKPIYLCDREEADLKANLVQPNSILLKECTPEAIHKLIYEIEKEEIKSGLVICEDFEQLYENFSRAFTVITAAGGVVENEKKQILLIFRRGKWDLPKGKLDEGESIEECAIREVCEETGLRKVVITEKLPDTYHTYQELGKNILKKSVWYKMTAESNQTLRPQLEEEITEIKWVPADELKYYLNNTYPSVRDVLNCILTGSL
jgi:8-oxo-dGTP pyrophosphatase MutT (NUDIX family)